MKAAVLAWRVACLGLAVGVASQLATAQEQEKPAKEKFLALEQKLRDILKKPVADHIAWYVEDKAEYHKVLEKNSFLFTKMLSPNQAKIVIWNEYKRKGVSELAMNKDKISNAKDIAAIYLQFYDGVWVTTRYECNWDREKSGRYNEFALNLMLAIDRYCASAGPAPAINPD